VEAGGRIGRDRQTKFCSRKCAFTARWRTGSKSKQLTIPQAAYLAGVIDGEGSIMLYGRRDSVAMRVAIANTNQKLLEWCAITTGVGNIVITKRDNPKHKTSANWIANSQAAASVLEQVLPFLTIKKEQAQMALDFQKRLHLPAEKSQREWQQQWRTRMRGLNARGSPEKMRLRSISEN